MVALVTQFDRCSQNLKKRHKICKMTDFIPFHSMENRNEMTYSCLMMMMIKRLQQRTAGQRLKQLLLLPACEICNEIHNLTLSLNISTLHCHYYVRSLPCWMGSISNNCQESVQRGFIVIQMS